MIAISAPATHQAKQSAIQWARVVLVKNRPWILFLRVVIPSLILSMLGALFVASGPAEMDVATAGTPGADAIPLVLIGYLIVGQLVVLLSCGWIHLREITSKELGLSYTVFPSRLKLITGEALIAAAVGAAASFVSVLGAFTVYAVVAKIDLGAMFSATSVLNALGRVPLTAALLAVIALALAVLIRNPIVTVLVVVVWASVGEDLLARIPGIGSALQSAAPLTNSYYFNGMTATPGIAGNPWLCFAWLAAVCAVLFALAVAIESRRKSYM